jgi:hypothetical protein
MSEAHKGRTFAALGVDSQNTSIYKGGQTVCGMGCKGRAYFEVPEGCVECYGLEVGSAVRMREGRGDLPFWWVRSCGDRAAFDV